MKFIVKEIIDKKEKENIAREVLNDLPEWFGIPGSTENYIKESQAKPFLTSSPDCAEIFVMGVKKKFHYHGAGRELNKAYEDLAKSLGYTYTQVKTVQSGHYDEYDITNKFYKAVGYKELEVFPDLWDESNPCQIYVKYLA